MIYFIKKYWKHALVFIGVIIFGIMLYISNTYYDVKESGSADKTITKKTTTKKVVDETVFVDVKGAVNAPGVYELEKGKRVIDAINLAGGLSDNANTININLSKILTDEMYVVVYTKNEIANYKKQTQNNKQITCASNECICPDASNDACIKKEDFSSSTSTSNKKISINTASKEELMTLSSIGESKADAIIKYREENGKFNSIEEIKNVSGIGESIYEKIKDSITL